MAELIRSYVQASTTFPSCKWRRKLSSLERDIWVDLTHQPTYSGIFTFDVEERAWYYGVTVDEIESALQKFVDEGKILRDGEYIRVVEFVDHQHYTPPSWKAVASELNKLENKTNLVQACVEHIAPLCAVKDGFMALYTRRYETIRDENISAKDELASIELKLGAKLLSAWNEYKQMVRGKRVTGKVADSVFLKHWKEITDHGYSDDALRYGLGAAVKANAEASNYVIKAASGYGERRKPDHPEYKVKQREII